MLLLLAGLLFSGSVLAQATISEASWDASRKLSNTLYVKGTAGNNANVTITNPDTLEVVGQTSADRRGRWQLSKKDPASVPCRVKATDAGGASLAVAVANAPADCKGGVSPAVSINSFSASANPITLGQSFTLNWGVSNATGCTAGGSWSGTKDPVSGSESQTPTSTGSLTYTLDCTGAGAPDNASVTVTVNPVPAVSIDSFSASANPITLGQSFTLNWGVSNATGCTAGGSWSGTKDPVSGSESQTPASTGSLTYTLDCTGAGAPDNASITITVTDPGQSAAGRFDQQPKQRRQLHPGHHGQL